jgi:hypothetical protein
MHVSQRVMETIPKSVKKMGKEYINKIVKSGNKNPTYLIIIG